MADTKISALDELPAPPRDAQFVVNDPNDTSMALSGTNKRVPRSAVLDVFLPEEYGAVGDGVRVTDAAISSSSDQLSSTTAGFIAADEGKDVLVVGAGASGADLITTILSVSAGVATLATTAGTTVSGAEAIYGTDDTNALQGCIDAALASDREAVVRLAPATIYVVSSAPRTDRGGNCVLSVADPDIDPATEYSVKRLAIVGRSEPGAAASSLSEIACLRTGDTYSSTNGPPSVIGGTTKEQGFTYNQTGPVFLRGFRVRLPTNPAIAGIDGISWGGTVIEGVHVWAGSEAAALTALPTNAHAFGFRLPTLFAFGLIQVARCEARGMYAGYVLYVCDHVRLDLATATFAVIALAFQDPIQGGHPMTGSYLISQYCSYALAGWLPDTGVQSPTANAVYIEDLNIDIEQLSSPFNLQKAWLDANNQMRGNVRVHFFTGVGVGVLSAAQVTGGANLVMMNTKESFPSVGSGATITLPPGAEVVNITGTTTITSVTAGRAGRRVTLRFGSTAQVTDGSNLKLAGNFTGGADRTLTLISDGTNWLETSRSAN